VIFVTVGTTHFPFARLVDAVEGLVGNEIVLQHGPAPPPVGITLASAFMLPAEMLRWFDTADVIVCHAGVGSMLAAVREGHTPVVVPRMRRLGETVDDHQVQLARALAREGKAINVEDVDDLARAVAAVPARRPRASRASGTLHAAVRAAL
jgi:UDP-N-acetylglucosamine transferase subunit ALG13